MRIPASDRNLRNAFQHHVGVAQSAPIQQEARNMHLYYAAECGLKWLLMQRSGFSVTDDLPEDSFGADGHDLIAGVKSLRLSASRVSEAPRRIRTRRGEI